MVFGLGQGEVVEYGDNHCRRGVGRAETVAAANDERTVLAAIEGILHVEIERFAIGARLFRAVEHGNLLGRGGNSLKQMLDREGAIEVNADHTDFFAFGVEMVDGFAGSFGH